MKTQYRVLHEVSTGNQLAIPGKAKTRNNKSTTKDTVKPHSFE